MFPDRTVNYLPGLYPLPPNHRMKLAGRGHRFAWEPTQPDVDRDRLAARAAALQLMRGR
jgi:hypothetical protein